MKVDFKWIPLSVSDATSKKKTWVLFGEDRFGKNHKKTLQPTSTHIGLAEGRDTQNQPTLFEYKFYPIIGVNGKDGLEAQTWLRYVDYNDLITFTDDENSEYVALSMKVSKTIPNDPNDYYIFRVGEGVAENPPVQQLFYARLRGKNDLNGGTFKRWSQFPIVSSDGSHINQVRRLQVDEPCFHPQVGGLLLHSAYYNYYNHHYGVDNRVYLSSAQMDSAYTNDNIEFSTNQDPLVQDNAYSGYMVFLNYPGAGADDNGYRNIGENRFTQNLSYVCESSIHPDDLHLLKTEIFLPHENETVKVKFNGVGVTSIIQYKRGVATMATTSSHPEGRGVITDIPYNIKRNTVGIEDVSHIVSIDGSYYKSDYVYTSGKAVASKDKPLEGKLREYDWYPELNDMIVTRKGHGFMRDYLWFITYLEYEVTDGDLKGKKIYDFSNHNQVGDGSKTVRTKAKISSLQLTATPLAMPYMFERTNAHPASYNIALKDILPDNSIHELLCISFLLISPTTDFKGHKFDDDTGAIYTESRFNVITYYPIFFLTTLTDAHSATMVHLSQSPLTLYRRGSDLVLKSHYLRNEIVVRNVSADKHLIKVFINHRTIGLQIDRRKFFVDIPYIKHRRNVELFEELGKFNLMFYPLEDMMSARHLFKCTGGWFTMSELRLELYNM